MIPGNETSVFTVINELARVGVTVVHQGVAKVHVSGHASAGELLFLYNAVRPRNVIPVHGEWRHLRAQARIAVSTGVPPSTGRAGAERHRGRPDQRQGARVSGHIEVGMVYVDGNAVGDVGEDTLSDRLILGEGGFISITVAIDAHTGRAVASPDDLRPRLLRRPEGAGRGRAAGRGRTGPDGGGRGHRPAPGRAVRPRGWSGAGWATPTAAGR